MNAQTANPPKLLQTPLSLVATASTIQPEVFQQTLIDNITSALLSNPTPPCLLRAPTGSGKTFVIGRVLERVSEERNVVWFWFVPFVNLVAQTQDSLLSHAPSLSPSLLSIARNQTIEPGSVLISTAQGVARAQARTKGYDNDSDDAVRSLAATVARARADGMQVGMVVDEAHIGLDKSTEFGKFAHWLSADYLLMATATPKDDRLSEFLAQAGYNGQVDFSVSRADVVHARLNKQYIEAVVYNLGATMQKVTDLQRTVLRQAWTRNLVIGQHLERHGVDCVPLLLVQVANGNKTVEDAEAELVAQCGVPPDAIGKHSSDDPDPILMAAIANDTTKRVLIFKQSAGTGFDAPRAFVLASTKSVNDPDFAMQFVGRVMRVPKQVRNAFPRPAPIPAELNTAFVYLSNSESQAGFEAAVSATTAVQTDLAGQIGRLAIRRTVSGAVVITNVPTQSAPLDYRFGLIDQGQSSSSEFPQLEVGTTTSVDGPASGGLQWSVSGSGSGSGDLFGGTAFGLDAVLPLDPTAPAQAPKGLPRTRADVLAALGENRMKVFHRKLELPALGVALKTEVKPDMVDLSQITLRIARELPIASELSQTAVDAALNRVTQKETHKELTDGRTYHEMIQVVTNRSALAREARIALQDLPHAEEEDYRIIVRTISERLRPAIEAALADPSHGPTPTLTVEQISRDAAHWVIRDCAKDLYEAMFAAIASQAKLVDAQPLPDLMIFPQDIPLSAADKNIYGIMPPSATQHQDVDSVLFMEERAWWADRSFDVEDGHSLSVGRFDGWLKLNKPEAAFATAVDSAEFVVWWHRNPDRKPYATRVVRADHEHYFYPDFVVCVIHEEGMPPLQRLVETKNDTKDAVRKAKHFPPAYGKVLFITEDNGRMFRITENGSLGELVTFSNSGSFLELMRTSRP